MTARRWTVVAVLGVAALLLVGRASADVIADGRWYAALGAGALWRRRLLTIAGLQLVSGAVTTLFVFANLYAVRHSVVSLVLPRRVANLEIGQEVPGGYLVAAAALLAVLLGALLTLPASSWTSFTLARHGVPFGETDPYFEADLGFYLYWLPFESALYLASLIAVLVVTAVVVFLYALTPSLRWERSTLYVSQYVRRHFVVLGSVLLLLLAWSYRLDAYKLLIAGSGPGGAFTYSDHRATIPVDLWLSIITVAAAGVVLYFGFTGQLRVAVITLGTLLVVALGAHVLAPPLARRFAPVADARLRDAPYEQVRVDYTRRAYALDGIRNGDTVSLGQPVTAASAISVWTPPVLERALAAAHRLDGAPRGAAWRAGANGLEALIVTGPAGAAGRAADSPGREPWSVVAARAAVASAGGDPVLAAGTPPWRGTLALPPVIVSDSVTGYAVVPDSAGTVIDPTLGSGLTRLAEAWSLQNFRLLSGDFSPTGTRLVTRRDAHERVSAIAPFFAQNGDPRPVVAADSLYWVAPLYAASATYPLSERVTFAGADLGFLRLAATAVVNAHTGRVTLVPVPVPDPLTRTWMQLFPALFEGGGALPARLLAAIVPDAAVLRVEAALLARDGLRGAAPPRGTVAWSDGADSLARDGGTLPIVLPSGALALAQPVLDSSDRIAGLLVAVGHEQRGAAGSAVRYWIPAAHPGARWNTVVDEMRRALDSTAAISRDARVVHGPVQAVPLDGGPALVQVAYAWRPDAAPVLARVAVARDSAITTGRTLAAALGVPRGTLADTGGAPPLDFHARVAELYARMRDAMKRGDWEAFGRAYDALGALLDAGGR